MGAKHLGWNVSCALTGSLSLFTDNGFSFIGCVTVCLACDLTLLVPCLTCSAILEMEAVCCVLFMYALVDLHTLPSTCAR
jgi:hypothetical protein